jgi:aryl-alcohol dehydrogenase-like predicted oxidoreductase
VKYVKLGKSGLDISPIGLGCMSFGAPDRGYERWTLPETESLIVIKEALELGINFLDTANLYSLGASEEIVGRAVREHANRDEIVVATKIYFPLRQGPNLGGLSRKAIFAEVDACLGRLNLDYIDLLQIHRFDPATPLEESLEALHDIVKAGKARYLGASSMHAWQFAKALYLQREHGWTRFVSMQNHYSLLNREEENEMLPLCADADVAVVVWSPLARGVLTREWGAASARSETDGYGRTLFQQPEAEKAIVDAVGAIAAERGVSRAQVALAWLSRNPVVSAPIVGATESGHLRDAIKSLDLSLTDDEVARLEAPYLPQPRAGY